MGIKDLLRFMKPYIKPIHIRKYAGKRVGIDAYSWLHKGAYSCSMELCLNSNSEKKSRYLDYFMHRINLLRHYEITPVVVFDGGKVPCKAATEQERYRKRETNRVLAMEKLQEGNVNAATELFQKAISISPAMAHQLIQILRSENVEFVVAPYEADAQLAYLSSLEVDKGGIAAVITEDSDLIAYGCQATVFKMDRYGNGEELLLDDVFSSTTCTPSFRNFDTELFIGMCVFAGCDFLPSVPGIGMVKAYSMVSKYRNLDRVLSYLKSKKGSQMPEDYSKSFREALAVFQHARIYDGDTKKLKHIKPLPEKLMESLDGELDFLGPDMPASVAIAIAEGHLDPVSMEAFDCRPSPGCHQDPVNIKTSGTFQRPDALLSQMKTNCMVFSSHKTVAGERTDTSVKQNPGLNESRYFHDGAALQKLLLPLENDQTVKTARLSFDIALKVPDNNPFKKRKLSETPFELAKPISEEVSVVINNEDSEILCVTTENIISKVPKAEGNYLAVRESIKEEISMVTELGDSDLYISLKSQESVNSKPRTRRVSEGKGRSNLRKRKTNNSNSSVKKSTSILNFFSRV